jgi:hypothetical protein
MVLGPAVPMLITLLISILIVVVVATILIIVIVPIVCYGTVVILQSLYINIFIFFIFIPTFFLTGAIFTATGIIS